MNLLLKSVGTKNMPNNLLCFTCNFHDAFLCGSWTASLGNCCFSYKWSSTLQLRIFRSRCLDGNVAFTFLHGSMVQISMF
jgi:hypothetical protein